jgi:hypothetical protein
VAYYVGLNVRENTIQAADPVNPATGTKVGFKTAFDAYLRPTDQSMLSAYVSYSTAYDAYYARLRAGYVVFGAGYLGPVWDRSYKDGYFGTLELRAGFADLRPYAVRERNVLFGHAAWARQMERVVLLRLRRVAAKVGAGDHQRILGHHRHRGLRDGFRIASRRLV